ncbi:MAG: hypothetical protein HKO66_07100 [Saprospiraceae bacterium]|nr:hypothetical protein [Bacteroidia bacterium]NNE13512.1 hypothetical protein [Saprospiraceae bacterium]NNL91980.1 hypothetical protein [Saprospiraceae bacterium]
MSVLFLSCNLDKKTPYSDSKSDDNIGQQEFFDFELLLGKWKRTNDSEGKVTYESWHQNEEGKYEGFGCTLQHGDTIWQEKIEIDDSEGYLYFKVTDKTGHSVPFKIMEQSQNSFSCHNKENDFPKTITYKVNKNKIMATISGGGTKVDFDFVKMDKPIEFSK